MIITRRRYRELLSRMERLEANAKANSWTWGEVDFSALVKIVDKMNADIKKLSAATDRNKV